MSVAVTGLYAGILGVVFFVLSMRAISNRVRAKVNLLDGGDEALTRAMRVHGNFAEYVPFTLLLMVLAEIQGGSGLFIHVSGDGFDRMPVVSRLRHNRDDGSESIPIYRFCRDLLRYFCRWRVLHLPFRRRCRIIPYCGLPPVLRHPRVNF